MPFRGAARKRPGWCLNSRLPGSTAPTRMRLRATCSTVTRPIPESLLLLAIRARIELSEVADRRLDTVRSRAVQSQLKSLRAWNEISATTFSPDASIEGLKRALAVALIQFRALRITDSITSSCSVGGRSWVAGVCGTPQPRPLAGDGATRPGSRSTADPCHPMPKTVNLNW
jgi:hypothetical protein